jgi:hypothetical protein
MARHGDPHQALIETTRPLIREALDDWHRRGRRVESAVVFVVVVGSVAEVAVVTMLTALQILDWHTAVLDVVVVPAGFILVVSIIDDGLRVHRARLVRRRPA